jgi:deoxyadenosine/deoxycytidine kinase
MHIVIDGNIGSGKTTQLGLLEQKGYIVRREAISEWPLEEFYNDPSRWAFLLHTHILLTNQPPLDINSLLFFERSLVSSRWVFWEVIKQQGDVTAKEDEVYSKLYEKHEWHPDLFIYMSKSPELCLEHIRGRYQPGDQAAITLDYLQKLDAAYTKMLSSLPCKILMIDAAQSADKIHSEICSYLVENELFIRDTEWNKV